MASAINGIFRDGDTAFDLADGTTAGEEAALRKLARGHNKMTTLDARNMVKSLRFKRETGGPPKPAARRGPNGRWIMPTMHERFNCAYAVHANVLTPALVSDPQSNHPCTNAFQNCT